MHKRSHIKILMIAENDIREMLLVGLSYRNISMFLSYAFCVNISYNAVCHYCRIRNLQKSNFDIQKLVSDIDKDIFISAIRQNISIEEFARQNKIHVWRLYFFLAKCYPEELAKLNQCPQLVIPQRGKIDLSTCRNMMISMLYVHGLTFAETATRISATFKISVSYKQVSRYFKNSPALRSEVDQQIILEKKF